MTLLSLDVSKKHKSHISSRRAKNRGWRRVPDSNQRNQTRDLLKDYQILNCKGCKFSVPEKVGTGELCCAYKGKLKTEPGKCLRRKEIEDSSNK
jgi:hypothetical protein